MKPLPPGQMKENLLDLLSEQLQGVYPQETELLRNYRLAWEIDMADAYSVQNGTVRDVRHLTLVKQGIRAASLCLNHLLDKRPGDFEGWYYGAMPANYTQRLGNQLNKLILRMTASAVEIERDHPHFADWFERERKTSRARHDIQRTVQ